MIFTPSEWIEMTDAVNGVDEFAPREWKLSELCYRIATIDDPYYSRLKPRTYMAAARLASPSRIAELVAQHGE
jgi:hypothetical protein